MPDVTDTRENMLLLADFLEQRGDAVVSEIRKLVLEYPQAYSYSLYEFAFAGSRAWWSDFSPSYWWQKHNRVSVDKYIKAYTDKASGEGA